MAERYVIRRGLTSLTLRHEWTYPFGCCGGCCWYSSQSWALDRDGRVPVTQGARGDDVYITCADQAQTKVNVTSDEGFIGGLCAPDKAIIANDISHWIRTYGRGAGSLSGERRSASRIQRAQQNAAAARASGADEEA